MSDQPAGVVRIFGLEDDEDGRVDRRLPFRKSNELRLGWGEVPVDKLRSQVETFLASMGDVLSGVSAKVGEYKLQQVQISVEVSAKGQVSLLGTGGELAGKSGLTFTFAVPPPADRPDEPAE